MAAPERWSKAPPGAPLKGYRARARRTGRRPRQLSLYVDSSALLKRYVDEPDSEEAVSLLESDSSLVTARHTIIEVRRNLHRLLVGREATAARADFELDLQAFAIVELDEVTCEGAAGIAEATGARSLDALHLSAARRVGAPAVAFLTFDRRQAHAARQLGFTVLGA